MTETEWFVSKTLSMFRFLDFTLSQRKTRLFGCAFCRTYWNCFAAADFRQAVEVAELFADGIVGQETLLAACEAARRTNGDNDSFTIGDLSELVSGWPSEVNQLIRDDWVFHWLGSQATITQAALFRDIVGNPFRPPPTLDAAWLHWHDTTIPRLAQQMYDARDFASMPILADALEEAVLPGLLRMGHAGRMPPGGGHDAPRQGEER